MKLKPSYIYLIAFTVALVTIILFTTVNKNSNESVDSIPTDAIHGSNAETELISPSSKNVSAAIIQKMKELENYISTNPTDTAKLKEYADLLLASHNENQAIEYYQNILDKDLRRTDILQKMALIKFNRNELAEAKSYISQIVALDPENVEAIYNLGVIEAKIGDIEAAKKQWADLMKNHPNTKMSDLARESIKRLSEKGD